MDTQEARSKGGEVLRRVAYVVLPTIITGCLVYAFVIDQSGKNIAVLGAGFACFIGLIALLGHIRGAPNSNEATKELHRPNVNRATGLPMNGLVDSRGNFRGSGRRYE